MELSGFLIGSIERRFWMAPRYLALPVLSAPVPYQTSFAASRRV